MLYIPFEQIVYADGYKVSPNSPMFCPECKDGLAMWRYGFRKRKIRDFQGKTYWIGLQRYCCPKCRKIYVVLPNFLVPYKQYDRMTIQSVQNGYIKGCGASYLSIYLWKRYYPSRKKQLLL